MNNFKQKFTSFLRGRNFASGVFVAIVIAAVVFVNIICYTLTDALGLYFYSVEKPDFSISDTFEELFLEAEADGERVTVTFCMEEDDLKSHSTGSYVYETAKRFAEKYDGFISLRFVNLITMYDADGNDVSVELENYKKDMRGNDTPLSKSSVVFRSGENYKVVTDYTTGVGYADFFTLDSAGYVTSYVGEETFASMVGWVLTDDHGTAYFTVGHGETANRSLYTALNCAGYYVDTINLRDKKITIDQMQKKLDEADLILISNPTTDFERSAEGSGVTAELDLLDYYARGGGSFFVTLDPYSSEVKLANIFGLLASYGISMLDYEDEGRSYRQTIRDMDNGITTDGFTLVADFSNESLSQEMKGKLDGGRVILRDVAPLKLSGAAKPLLTTSPSSQCYSNGEVTDSEGGYTIAAFSEKIGSTGNFSTLFFIPSIYLTATDAMVTRGYANKDFVYSVFDVLFGRDNMPYGTNSIIYDSGVLENLTMGMARVYTAILIAIPAAIAVAGAVVLIRRKNR